MPFVSRGNLDQLEYDAASAQRDLKQAQRNLELLGEVNKRASHLGTQVLELTAKLAQFELIDEVDSRIKAAVAEELQKIRIGEENYDGIVEHVTQQLTERSDS